MLSLLRRHRRPPARAPRRRVRPQLEGLEPRDCPAAPVIAWMSYTELPQKVLCITGSVSDDQGYADVTVNLTGVVNVATTVTDTGQFTVQVAADHLGLVMGEATDSGQQLTSESYALEVSSNPPVLGNFNAAENADGTWTFSGQVSDAVPQGDTITFGGLNALQGKTATVDVSGNFSLTVPVAAGDDGTATAQATDQWGQTSNLGEDVVRTTDTSSPTPTTTTTTTSSPPVIAWMSYTELPQKVLCITGSVSDGQGYADVTVNLTGVVTLTTTVTSTGQFTAQVAADHLGTVTAEAYDATQQLTSVAYTLEVSSNPPVLGNFNAAENADGTWTFSGQVSDAVPQGDTITFGGLNALQGKTATVDASGNFSLTVPVAAGDDGTAMAQATDQWGQISNLGEDVVRTTTDSTPPATACAGPVIDTLTVAANADGTWTISGEVTDSSASGDTVTFGGLAALQGDTATVAANGAFTLTVALPAGTQGTVTAVAADGAGLTSGQAQVSLPPPPAPAPAQAPVIDSFTSVENPDGTWTFSGHVTDPTASGDTVTLGGLAALQGQVVTVDASGDFTFTAALPAGTQGTATAVAADGAGLTSSQAALAVLVA
jgi:hypothetical protein